MMMRKCFTSVDKVTTTVTFSGQLQKIYIKLFTIMATYQQASKFHNSIHRSKTNTLAQST